MYNDPGHCITFQALAAPSGQLNLCLMKAHDTKILAMLTYLSKKYPGIKKAGNTFEINESLEIDLAPYAYRDKYELVIDFDKKVITVHAYDVNFQTGAKFRPETFKLNWNKLPSTYKSLHYKTQAMIGRGIRIMDRSKFITNQFKDILEGNFNYACAV